MASKKLFLLDAMALIYRAHFVFINNPRRTSQGLDTSALFGFTNSLLEVLEKQQPSHIAVCFDAEGPTFRHEEFEAYKAQRDAPPEELIASIPYVKRLLEGFKIPAIEKSGFEADDIIGTLATQAASEGFEVYMMTPDKDYAQLVTDKVFLFRPGLGGKPHEKLDPEGVLAKFGVGPEFITDYLGMKGDAVDNLPGIPKVGDKTAAKLIKEFGHLEDILQNIENVSGNALKKNLTEFGEQGLATKRLATIHTSVPGVQFDAKQLEVEAPDKPVLAALFQEVEFRTIAKRVLGEEMPSEDGQGNLFATAVASAPAPEGSSLESTNTSYQLIRPSQAKERAALLKQLSKQELFCFDTETTSLDARHAELVGIAFSWAQGEAAFVAFPEEQDEALTIAQEFIPLFADAKSLKIAHNAKYDLAVLRNYGIELGGTLYDTMLAHYVVRSDGKHGMDALAQSYLAYTPVSIETLIGKKGKHQKSMRDVPLEQLNDYACEDADITLQLYHHLEPEVKAQDVEKVLHEVDLPLVPVLLDMEEAGICLDGDFLTNYSTELGKELEQTRDQCYQMAGLEFNLNSPKQLGEILFDRLKIIDNPKKTKTGQYKTDEETLQELAGLHDLPALILEYRSIAKLKSTYVDALPDLIDPSTGRVHTTYNQAVAVTGRLSSNNPNLQNIPIRTERGREVRKAFIAQDDSHLLLAADYSQIELRIMAHLSGDEGLKQAFIDGEDIHRATAGKIFGVKPAEVTDDQRRTAKTANFGIIYGITAFGLSQRVNIDRSQAKQIIDTYFEQYPGVAQFMEDTKARAKKEGLVRTMLGRVHHLPNITSRNFAVRGFAERNAINTPIQGSAADMIKLAMIRLHKRLKTEKLHTKMLLQVHDELVFEVPKNELDTVKPIIVECMQGALQLDVPLEVSVGAAQNWLDAH